MIVIASLNPHKVAEIIALPAAKGLDFKLLGDYGAPPTVEERGTTFEENAVIKAVGYSLWIKRSFSEQPVVVAEDAGLEIETELSWPGVKSARLAPTDKQKITAVLYRLKGRKSRTARFIACTALAINGYLISTWRGVAQGRITHKPRGKGGFGYDPIFEDEKLGLTFAEMTAAQKNKYSHRNKAWRKALDFIKHELKVEITRRSGSTAAHSVE